MADRSSIRRTPKMAVHGIHPFDASSDDEEEESDEDEKYIQRNKRRREEQDDSSAATVAEAFDLFLVQDALPAESESLADCCNIKAKPTAWAYHRFAFLRHHDQQLLAEEILQWNDKIGYALHGLLHQCVKGTIVYTGDGECNSWDPRPLILALLEFASSHCDPDSVMSMLLAECPHHYHRSHMGRTALHIACWGTADMNIMAKLVQACPDALLAVDHEDRTPTDVLQFYHLKKKNSPQQAFNKRRLNFLEEETDRLLWRRQRQLEEEEDGEE